MTTPNGNGHGLLVPLPRQPGRPRTRTLAPTPDDAGDVDCAQHPAYEALREACSWVGGSIAAAHAMVADFWDTETQGELPDVRTVQRWAQQDDWDGRWLDEIQQRGVRQTAMVNLALQQLQLLAIRAAREILLEQGNPKFATAKRGIFRDVMWLTGAGVIGTRYGLPDTSGAAETESEPDDDLGPQALADRTGAEYLASRRRQS